MPIKIKKQSAQKTNNRTTQKSSNSTEEYKHEPMPVLKAVRLNCLECCGGSSQEVKLCKVTRCYMYPFRLGKNPYRQKRELTDEQKREAAERLRKAREAKKC